MPVNSTHPEYDSNIPAWLRIRDLPAAAAIKAAGEKYIPRLDAQPDDEFRACVQRGFCYNAVADFGTTRPSCNWRHLKCV